MQSKMDRLPRCSRCNVKHTANANGVCRHCLDADARMSKLKLLPKMRGMAPDTCKLRMEGCLSFP